MNSVHSPRPTAEQATIRDAYLAGGDLVVEAGAGTGKTTTLRMLADADQRRGVYIAYNKVTADDAGRRFPGRMACSTAHALAYRAVGKRYRARLGGPRLRAQDTAAILGRLDPVAFEAGVVAGLARIGLARLTLATVDAFCKAADDEVGVQHVPHVPALDQQAMAAAREAVTALARSAWAELNQPVGDLEFSHNTYLKMWALTRPRLHVDVVVVDEAQDLNPCVAQVVDAQTHAQRVAVGDRCQPAGTLVAVVRGTATRSHRTVVEQVPIEDVREGDRVVSFDIPHAFLRRSGSPVSGVTARPFDGALVRATTEEGHSSAYTPDHHCIAHVGPAFAGRHVLYLMRRGGDYRIGIATGIRESQGNMPGFILRAAAERADAAWVLDTFADRGDAAAAEIIASLEHRIPQLTFRAGNRSVMSQDRLDALWAKLGSNEEAAAGLLAQYGRSIDHPLWASGDHRLLVRRAAVVRACNLLDGMTVLTREGAMDAEGKRAHRNRWSPIKVTREPYRGLVYSMTVDRDHTYIGDGIVTHNCQAINGWNGAVNAMAGWSWRRLSLTQSFRFGPDAAEVANQWLDVLDAPLRLTGLPTLDTRVGYVAEPDAILCRSNIAALNAAARELDAGRRVAMVGGTRDVKALAYAARDLQAGRPTDHPQFIGFKTWDDVREYAESDSGSDLRTFVKMIDQSGPGRVLAIAGQLVEEAGAEVVTSTVHKAKGREWPRVLIGSDFPQPGDVKPDGSEVEFTRDDAMLAYVAVTRGREQLDPGGLAFIDYKRPDLTPATVAA